LKKKKEKLGAWVRGRSKGGKGTSCYYLGKRGKILLLRGKKIQGSKKSSCWRIER